MKKIELSYRGMDSYAAISRELDAIDPEKEWIHTAIEVPGGIGWTVEKRYANGEYYLVRFEVTSEVRRVHIHFEYYDKPILRSLAMYQAENPGSEKFNPWGLPWFILQPVGSGDGVRVYAPDLKDDYTTGIAVATTILGVAFCLIAMAGVIMHFS